MIPNTFQKEIEEAVRTLFDKARELTYNRISDHCKFILTEIKVSQENFHIQRQLRKKENDEKIPVTLIELMPKLQILYENFYDINLYIYRTTMNMTVIDFRYFPKSSLDPEYRQKVLHNPPMLHCKVAQPSWLSDKKGKFDINWEHYGGLNRLRLLWLKLKFKTKNG
jgi:hypothetical protein